MRGGLFVFPLFVDPEEATTADAREELDPVASQPVVASEAFNPQRLAALVRSGSSGGLGEASETTADVLNALPKWAQAVVQSGCFNVSGGAGQNQSGKLKRALEQDDSDRPRKRRSMNSAMEDSLEDESGELQDCLNELNAAQDVDLEDGDVLPVLATQAERVADSVERYTELLEQLLEKATQRQQNETFERDEMDVFSAADAKMVLQLIRTMEKSDWIRKLEPQLLISLMSAFDTQVRLGLALDIQSNLSSSSDGRGQYSPKVDDRLVSRLQMSLDVAICELIVMTTPQVDRRVLSEETIDNCIQILHHVIRRLLLPCIDTTFVTSVSGPIGNENSRRQSTGGKSSGVSRVNLRSNKIIRKAVDRIIPVVCEFIDQLATLILGVKLADRWVLQLSSSMIELFALEHSSYASSLQQSGLSVLRSIFLQYKPHRDLLLEEIVGVMMKLPTAKRSLRTVKLVESGDSVQRISILVISMIQSCTPARYVDNMEIDSDQQRATADPSSTPDTVSEEKPAQKTDIVRMLLEETRCSAQSFVRVLLKACWKKNEERDNRSILENFVKDLLVMFVRPEWAGAEDLLEVLSSSLASVLHATVAKDSKKPDSQQSLTALNLIGIICAAIKKYQKEVEQSTLEDDSESVSVIEEHTRLLRNELVGDNARTKLKSLSRADGNQFRQVALQHIVVMHLQRHNFDRNDSKKLLLLKFITSSKLHWNSGESTLMEQEQKIWESLWDVPMSSTFKVAAPTSDLALKASLHLAIERDFCGLFDSLLAHVMGLLSKGMSSLRARVMKSLRGIVNIDPMLMADNSVQSAVRMCCSDERPSVRHEAVELVGTYVMQQQLLFDRYFDILAERLRDKAITVRKSVCRIFKIALTSLQDESRNGDDAAQNLRRKSACMRSLVERVGDAAEDQSVKNFVIDTFQEVWFGAELWSARLSMYDFGDGSTLPPGWRSVTSAADEISTSHLEVNNEMAQSTRFVSQDGITVNSIEDAWNIYPIPIVAPASVVKSNRSKEDSTPEVVTTIVEVAHGMANLDWFAELLKRLLKERTVNTKRSGVRSTKDRSAEVKIAKNRSEKIVGGLVNCLMDLQEDKLLQGVSMNDRHQQFLSCMKALSAFCEAKPLLLSRHLETVRVYLKEEDSKIQSLAVSMINNILSVGKVSERIVRMLEADLKDLVREAPPSVVGPSIKCLATLAATRKKPPVLLLNMLEHFFLFLQKHKDKGSLANLPPSENSSLQRALFAAGQIAGATDMDVYEVLKTEAKILKIGTVMSSLYETYAKFIRMPGNSACAAKAVQGIGSLFPIRPRLFLQAQQDGLLDLLLATAPEVVKLQCLRSLKELLLFEEERLERGLATQVMNESKSKEQQVQGDQEADASLIGNVMQVQLGNVLQLSLQNPPQVRMEAVACIGVLLTQGLVNPLQCIPNLVALETDRIVSNRDAAHGQLMSLHEKFSSQFQTPTIQGIQDSYSFQVSAFGNATPFALDKDKKDFCLFGRLYTTCLRPTRSQRVLFLRALVNQFTDRGSILHPSRGKSIKNSRSFQDDLKYLCYLAQIISALPFDVEDEPLYIIYWINRYVGLRLGLVLDDFKAIFAKLGVPKELMDDEDANLAKINIAEYSLTPLPRSKLAVLQSSGCIAFALALVLRLKFALKAMYDLDNEKCATYQPSATGSTGNEINYLMMPAQRTEKRKLLLPSVDDICRTENPIELGWSLFMCAWLAARKDQKQFDFDATEEISNVKKSPSKRRRRSRKSMTTRHQVAEENDDEYVEGFA